MKIGLGCSLWIHDVNAANGSTLNSFFDQQRRYRLHKGFGIRIIRIGFRRGGPSGTNNIFDHPCFGG
jgi:hypothetical protein